MATDETQGSDPADPGITAPDLMAATEGNDIQTEADVPAPEVTSTSTASTDESGTAPASADVPPEQVTPEAGGANVEVPSAAGDTSPPSSGVTADQADEASPTGGANVAGTPMSQLSQAPAQADESGSNIPAPNLVQPVADLPAAPSVTPDSQDPALVNPVDQAKARVEGRTSDAATRAEGTQIDEVPADIGPAAKASDGGPEAYPFPQGGDVDIATVPENTGGKEYFPALSLEDTVTLGEHELVPARLEGRRAFIVDAPRYLVPLDQIEDVWITVRTRDEVNATLTIPLSACVVERGGRSPVVRG